MSKTFKKIITIVFILLIVVVATICLVINSRTANFAYVSVNGEVQYVLDLKIDKQIEIKTGNNINIIEVKNRKVFVKQANCSGQDCVLTGKASKIGTSIICLPHKLIIELKKE